MRSLKSWRNLISSLALCRNKNVSSTVQILEHWFSTKFCFNSLIFVIYRIYHILYHDMHQFTNRLILISLQESYHIMFRVEDFWKQHPVGNVDDGDTERTSDNCESSWFYRASVKNSSKFQKNRNGFSEFNYASAFWFLDGYDYVVNCSDSYRWDEKQLVASGFASYNILPESQRLLF